MREADLGWLAGLLEGEGSFCLMKIGKSKTPSLQISLITSDGDVCAKAAGLMGTKPYGPYANRRGLGKKPLYQARTYGEAAARMMRQLLPFMGQRRAAKIADVLARWDLRPVKKRQQGLPADCHPDRPHYGRGLCRRCHFKLFRYDIHKLPKEEVARRLAKPVMPVESPVRRDWIFVSTAAA